MPREHGPACKLAGTNFGDSARLSAVMPSQIYAVGDYVGVANTFILDFGLSPAFFQQHVYRICQLEQLKAVTPCVLWLCSGYDRYTDLVDEAETLYDWKVKLALPLEFDKWLKNYMQCLVRLRVRDG